MTANSVFRAIVAASCLALAAAPALAQSKDGGGHVPCGAGMVENGTGLLHRAAFRRVDVEANHVRITFVGHATFVLESPQGVKVVTVYNDNFRVPSAPDIATMNIMRGNHSSFNVEPGVKYVLHGWDDGKGIPHLDVRYKDMRVYNVPVNISRFGSVATNFSSMFMFETAGLCIAHMGHLAHVLDDKQVFRMGRVDVALVPVDRIVSQSYEELRYNLKLLKPRLIIPMHFISGYFADDFAREVENLYKVKYHDGNTITVSHASLPTESEILILKPMRIFRFGGSDL